MKVKHLDEKGSFKIKTSRGNIRQLVTSFFQNGVFIRQCPSHQILINWTEPFPVTRLIVCTNVIYN